MDEKVIDLNALFDQATAYHYTAKVTRLREQMLSPDNGTEDTTPQGLPLLLIDRPWIRDLTYVSGTLAAFAAELYLKGFCMLHGIKPRRTHNLLELFSGLPEHVQNAIAELNQTSVKFGDILKYAQLNFVELRYMRMDPDKGFTLFAEMLTGPLHDYLLQQIPLRPERFHFADRLLPAETEWVTDVKRYF